jgi:hypothetical protein
MLIGAPLSSRSSSERVVWAIQPLALASGVPCHVVPFGYVPDTEEST